MKVNERTLLWRKAIKGTVKPAPSGHPVKRNTPPPKEENQAVPDIGDEVELRESYNNLKRGSRGKIIKREDMARWWDEKPDMVFVDIHARYLSLERTSVIYISLHKLKKP